MLDELKEDLTDGVEKDDLQVIILSANGPAFSSGHNLRELVRSVILDLEEIKLLTQLRVEFSDLRYHRYRNNFHCASPSCLCQTGIEDNEHFLLHCPWLSSQSRLLLELVSKSADVDIMCLSSNELTNILLYGHSKFTVVTNRTIIEATLKLIKSTGRFKRN